MAEHQQLDPHFFRDYGWDIRDRFNDLYGQTHASNPYGSDESVLNIDIRISQDGTREIAFPALRSRVWHDRTHFRRPLEVFHPDDECSIVSAFPWERYTEGDYFIRDPKAKADNLPEEKDNRLDRVIGVYWPKIDIESWDFRLLLLLPHKGDVDSPTNASFLIS